ncbi:MAG: serine hydrolase domain-containing protein, partial [Gammaproteobacteria bacterium]
MSPDRIRFTVAMMCLSAAFLSLHAAAQVVSPESVGLSSSRLARVDDVMQRYMDEHRFAGAVTLVARDDRIAYFNAQGLMDIGSGRPMEREAVFRIMSMTKPVVAVAILMMVEEGRVRLTDTAARFIPKLGGLKVTAAGNSDPVPASRDITVRDLLTHTAGFMTRGGASGEYPIKVGRRESLADVIPRLGDVPLDFEPGTRWAYSGQFAFDVLAHIVEIASGVAFDEFARERIFAPLGMNDTFFFPPDDHPRLTTLYQIVDGKLTEIPESDFVNGRYFSGGGGLFSTAHDYLQFALMLLHDGELGGKRLIGRRTAELMHSAFIPDSLPGRDAGEAYGLGVRVVTDSAARNTLLSEGSFGWSGAFNTHFFI